MKTNNQSPDATLSRLLHEARPAAELPPGFQNGVWRRIERASMAAEKPDWLGSALAWLWRPKFVLGGLAALLVMGASVGLIDGINVGKQVAENRYVASVSPLTVRQ